MNLFQQSMCRCDDCDAKDKPLAWFGPNVRICAGCRANRLSRASQGAAK